MTSTDGSPFEKRPPAAPSGVRFWLSWLDGWAERASERLNPILVKEARQALKSQQFLTTFSLLLIAAWAWSVVGIVLLLPAVYYVPGGRFLLLGYFYVLAVPLLVIVPFAAYRSLISEREDGTFELLAISTLSSRQIITGKLGSAVTQMLVYYSALSPCIAVTYLLRGVDVLTIGFLLFYTFLCSLALSTFGLLLATITRARHWQILLSVLLLLGLFAVTLMWTIPFTAMVSEGESLPFDDADFWITQVGLLCGYASYVVLMVMAAAALISFPSDNRSTKLRVVMLVQQLLLVGWILYFWLRIAEDEVLYLLVMFSGLHWFAMGTLMSGEIADLSPRVKRSLPQSFLGRMAFTWFNPGSGTGYTFAVTNLGAVVLLTMACGVGSQILGFGGAPAGFSWMWFGVLVWSYVAGYLGFARPLVRLIQPYSRAGLALPMLINILMALLGCAVPLFIHAWLYDFWQLSYSTIQVSNWFWTLEEAWDGGLIAYPAVPLVVSLAGAVIFGMNLLLTFREVEQVRLETPARVSEDERLERAGFPSERGGVRQPLPSLSGSFHEPRESVNSEPGGASQES